MKDADERARECLKLPRRERVFESTPRFECSEDALLHNIAAAIREAQADALEWALESETKLGLEDLDRIQAGDPSDRPTELKMWPRVMARIAELRGGA